MRAAVRIWLRIVGSEPALILALAVTTLTTVTVVTAGVRLYDRVSQDDLHQTLVDAEPEQRSIRVETDGRIGSGGPSDPFNQLERRAEVFHQTEMTDLVRSVVAGHEWVMQSPSFRVSSFPEGEDGPFTRTMRLRYQSGIEGQMTVVDGRRPQPRGTRPLLVGPDCPHDIT
ncbi:MAG: hypothetical protein OER95_00840, partial [Acidimicrobiia bacterium]|nr:hypothetical protein [Acidimicrobiia bacterium]